MNTSFKYGRKMVAGKYLSPIFLPPFSCQFVAVCVLLSCVQPTAQADDVERVADLVTPVMTEDAPVAGKRVRQVATEYDGTKVYHSLYLPVDWKRCPRSIPQGPHAPGAIHLPRCADQHYLQDPRRPVHSFAHRPSCAPTLERWRRARRLPMRRPARFCRSRTSARSAWGITKFIADLARIEVDKDELLQGRKEIGGLLDISPRSEQYPHLASCIPSSRHTTWRRPPSPA